MKKLFLLLLLISSVEAQQVVEQDAAINNKLLIRHVLVDTADGYTGKTGLSPTCKISIAGATDFSACSGSVTEADSTDAAGVYNISLGATEWETPGVGMMVLTGTGAIPSRIPFIVSPSKLYSNSNLIQYPNNLSGTGWATNAASITQNTTADWNGDTIGDTLTADGTTASHYVHTSTNVKRRGGSSQYVITAEVKSGTANNAWIGDGAWGVGVDINTSTGVVTPSVTYTYLKGWNSEAIGSSWYKVTILYEMPRNDGTYSRLTLGVGNGTASDTPPSISSSGTMIFARANLSRVEDVPAEQLMKIAPNIQSAASTSDITLAANEASDSSVFINREICVWHHGSGSVLPEKYKGCACIDTYNGTTKVATLYSSLWTTISASYKYRIGGYCSRFTSPAGSSITSSSFAADAITATAIASSAIGASELATDAAAEVADTTLRRTSANIEASGTGDAISSKSLYGSIAKQTHKTEVATSGGSRVFKTYKNDGTTVLSTRAVTTQSGAAPVVGVDD